MAGFPPSPRAWLPDGAIDAADIERRLGETVADWSAAWIAGTGVRVVGPLRGDVPFPAGERRSLGDALALAIDDAGRIALGLAMLGIAAPGAVATDADRALTASIANECLADLYPRLARLFGEDAHEAWVVTAAAARPGWRCHLAVADTPLATLRISDATMIALARAALPPPPPVPPLSPIAAALAAQDVTVSAPLGGCTVSLADFERLEAGDTLLLDHAVAAPIALAVDGHRIAGTACKVAQADDRLALTFLRTPDR